MNLICWQVLEPQHHSKKVLASTIWCIKVSLATILKHSGSTFHTESGSNQHISNAIKIKINNGCIFRDFLIAQFPELIKQLTPLVITAFTFHLTVCKEWVELQKILFKNSKPAIHCILVGMNTCHQPELLHPCTHRKSSIECAYMVFPQDWGLQVQRLSETPEKWDRWRDSQRRYIGQISSTCSQGDWLPVGASWGLSSHASSETLIIRKLSLTVKKDARPETQGYLQSERVGDCTLWISSAARM